MVKKIALIIVVLFLLIAIPVTFFVVKQQQELRQKAAPATTMTLSPAQKTAEVGTTFNLDVNIDTGENSIVAASVYLTFDPTKLQAQSIVNSSQFPNILSSGDTSQQGKVSIAVGTASLSQPFKGVGTVATVRFNVIQSSDAPITVRFGPETFAGSIGEGRENALIGTTPATITISTDGSTQPTPTPTTTSGTITPSPTNGSTFPTPTTGTGTITPTATPTGSSQLTLTSIANGASITQDPPTLSGKAPAGTAITITFYPGTTTGAVTADSSGNWTFTPSSALGVGTYTVTITSTNSVSGATQTITSTIIIANASTGTTPTPTYTPSPIVSSAPVPVTGSSDTTYLLIAIAVVFIVAGAVLPFAIR